MMVRQLKLEILNLRPRVIVSDIIWLGVTGTSKQHVAYHYAWTVSRVVFHFILHLPQSIVPPLLALDLKVKILFLGH